MRPSRDAWVVAMRVACAAFLLGMAGCAAHSIDVTRRTSLSGSARGARFIVLLNDDQSADPAYRAYGTRIVQQLGADGLVPAAKPAEARYAIMLARVHSSRDGDQNASAEDTESGRAMGGRGGYGGFGGHHGGHSMGSSQTRSDQTVLRIAMFDLTRPRSPQEEVFFAEIHGPRLPQDDDAEIDAMITAALRNFPGRTRERYAEPWPSKT